MFFISSSAVFSYHQDLKKGGNLRNSMVLLGVLWYVDSKFLVRHYTPTFLLFKILTTVNNWVKIGHILSKNSISSRKFRFRRRVILNTSFTVIFCCKVLFLNWCQQFRVIVDFLRIKFDVMIKVHEKSQYGFNSVEKSS